MLLSGCEGMMGQSNTDNTDGGGGPPAPPCAGCLEHKVGIGGEPFAPSSHDSEFVATDPNGALVLDNQHFSKLNRFLWVADTDLPGVVKIDLSTMTIAGRYRTGGSSTSRTTVNALGEAFIGSRKDGDGKAGVTKILPHGTSCPDRNGDGVVTTSTGADSVLPWGQDECVEWHVETEGDIRGLAAQDIAGPSFEKVCEGFQGTKEFNPKEVTSKDKHYVWVGGTHGKVYKLDAKTGKILLNLTAPVKVYGMALSPDGKLWLGAGAGGLGFVDTTKCTDQASCEAAPACTQTCSATDCKSTCDAAVKASYSGMPGGYGITVDGKGRVWRSGYPEAATMRFDFSAPVNQRLAMSQTKAYGGGIAADASGWIWAADLKGNVVRVNANTLVGTKIPAMSKGVAVDSRGRVLAIQYEGFVHLIEPGKTLTDFKLTKEAVKLKGIAYAYSDMTGTQARLADNLPGWYRYRFDLCDEGNSPKWEYMTWDVEVPPGTWAMFNVRTGDTLEQLKGAAWSTVACISPPGGFGQVSLAALSGKLMEAEVRFIASGDLNNPSATVASARIKSFSVLYRCVGVM
jgi:outer membrane protein assembly factor BamB